MLTTDQRSPALDIPLGIVYISGLLSVGGMVMVTLHNLFRLATNQISDAELVLTSEEDSEMVEDAISGEAKGGKEV
jgi:TRAP-type C4-dicarboxylate transport system permease small subunit